ncbi:MAG TPA: carboxy terminal-processing peptidase [Saprospiraceae bacterium]|nr:carboxy terminal-processing peptidase [Saprospiraceae bacterium]HMQ84199.1 carboxy terminal-processing peptidase [Saprospiraceae bacterium]
MKFRGPIFFSVVIVGLLVAAYFPAQESGQDKDAVLLKTIMNGFSQLHYQPKNIDDDFSTALFEEYLEQIDYGKRYLLQSEVDELAQFKTSLDDEIEQGSYQFFNTSVELLEKGLNRAEAFTQEILSKPFDFTLDETYEMDGEKRAFAKSETDLKQYWYQYLKYETLTRLTNKLEDQQEKGDEEKKSYETLEKEAREKVFDVFEDYFNRMKKLKREDRLSVYLNAITGLFDPHSEYYQPIDKENFNIRFSGRLEGIGATLRTEDDLTKVVTIVVGGPAWKQKEVEENDYILKVKQEGEEEATDLTGMQINDVVQLIRGPKDTKVTLTIKKVDGTVKDVVITRDIVVLEEQFAKSLIIDGENEGERIGYIYLPSFYADFQNKDGRFCSDDVEKELEKLKAEKVDGIILDLRNNGGGSLRDVVDMSGFFIEKGPIVQVKSRADVSEVLNDQDPSVQYAGPLIVMVNSFSASASEILAAALQDYERAIIVGSNSTFGKGTVQRFLDLDRSIRGYPELKPLGEIKLTTQKFYRIDGGSTQLRGVTPDIILPDNYAYIKTGEREYDNAMAWSEIEEVPHNQNVMHIKKLEELNKRSKGRVESSEVFQKIQQNAKRLETQRELSAYSLNLEKYQAFIAEREQEAKQYDDLFETAVNTNVKNLDTDKAYIEAEESRKARNTEWLESVSKDIYIKECLNIMHDLIGMN